MKNEFVSAQNIISSFNTWKYKREHPSSLEKLEKFIESSIEKREPIKFIMYWGKGDRDEIGEPEKKSFDFLNDFFQKIRNCYIYGVKVKVIFTDTHAELNGYNDNSINSYYNSLKNFSEKNNYEAIGLSKLVPYNEKRLLEKAEVLEKDEFIDLLTNLSKKHYKGNEKFDLISKLYYLQNQLEKKILEREFPDHIFLTFNGSKFNDLFPTKLPIFYMYSLEKGTSVKPWFI